MVIMEFLTAIERDFIISLRQRERIGYEDWEWGYGGHGDYNAESEFNSEIHNVEALGGRPIFVVNDCPTDDGAQWDQSYLIITSGKTIGRSCHDSTGYNSHSEQSSNAQCQGFEEVSGVYPTYEDLFLYGLTEAERKECLRKYKS